MPAQQGLWLHDYQSLLPASNQPGQQDQEHAIGPGDWWPVHLSLEDDELLAQEGIFRQKLGRASAKVGEGGQRQGGHERCGPTSKVRGECIQAAIQEALERDKNTSQTRSFSLT